jgi:phosphatidylethanolamine-binding protein (PEBP) family uncharacterized protein/parvulin-like peptidyl-prolyl isomerase
MGLRNMRWWMAALVAVVLGGCGAAGTPTVLKPGVIARVGNVSITEAELNRKISLAATLAESQSGAKVSKPLIFDPPAFTSCATAMRSAQPKPPGNHKADSARLPLRPFQSQCKTEYEQLKTNALERLIYVNWTIDESKRLGLNLSPAEIQQKLNEIKRRFAKEPGGYQAFLEKSGVSAAGLLREVTFNLLQGKLTQKVSNQMMAKANAQGVPHAQLAAYYQRNLSRYEHPEVRHVRLILTESLAAALQAKQEIASGKSFASVERRVSQYPNAQVKESGGTLPAGLMRKKFETSKHSTPGVATPNDEKIFEEAIFSANEHALVGPVKTSEAYFLFQVTAIEKEEPTEPLTQAEASIDNTLIYNHAARMLAAFNEELKNRWKATTNCAKGFVVLYCKQYVQHKEMSLREQSRLHGKEFEAIQRHQATEIALSSSAISKPTILAIEHDTRPSIASRYTCDGANISLPLKWSNLPRSTAEVLLTVEQVTRRGVRSNVWAIAGISPTTHDISAGSLPPGAILGRNSSGTIAWGGICPPKGTEYEYGVRLFALRKRLGLRPGFDEKTLEHKLREETGSISRGIIIAGYKRR